MADEVEVRTAPDGSVTRTGTAIPGGDGRQSDQPYFVVAGTVTKTTLPNGTVTITYEPVSLESPSFVQMSDGTHSVALQPDGSGGYGVSVVDVKGRRHQEKIELVLEDIRDELRKLNSGG